MKKLSLLLSVGVLAAVGPSHLLAAKDDGPKAKTMAKYDLNKNGKLDPEEIAAIQKDFAAAPEGELKRFDTDKDGKLSDAEIAAMVPGSGKKSGGKKKGDKSASTPETPAASAETSKAPDKTP